MKKYAFTLLLSITLFSACSKSSDSQPVAPQNPEKANVYTVDFKNPTQTYQHSLKQDIAPTSEAAISYLIPPAESVEIEVVSSSLKVAGCPASQVVNQLVWFANSEATQGIKIFNGGTFKTLANTEGRIQNQMLGLNDCTSIDISITLRQKPKVVIPPRACKESTDATCKVEMYCTQSGNSFLEVEVWKESFGTSLRKYSVSSTGSRTLSGLDTVNGFASGSQVTYRATMNSNSLSVNTANGVAVYTIFVNGQAFPTSLTCQSYL